MIVILTLVIFYIVYKLIREWDDYDDSSCLSWNLSYHSCIPIPKLQQVLAVLDDPLALTRPEGLLAHVFFQTPSFCDLLPKDSCFGQEQAFRWLSRRLKVKMNDFEDGIV